MGWWSIDPKESSIGSYVENELVNGDGPADILDDFIFTEISQNFENLVDDLIEASIDSWERNPFIEEIEAVCRFCSVKNADKIIKLAVNKGIVRKYPEGSSQNWLSIF